MNYELPLPLTSIMMPWDNDLHCNSSDTKLLPSTDFDHLISFPAFNCLVYKVSLLHWCLFQNRAMFLYTRGDVRRLLL